MVDSPQPEMFPQRPRARVLEVPGRDLADFERALTQAGGRIMHAAVKQSRYLVTFVLPAGIGADVLWLKQCISDNTQEGSRTGRRPAGVSAYQPTAENASAGQQGTEQASRGDCDQGWNYAAGEASQRNPATSQQERSAARATPTPRAGLRNLFNTGQPSRSTVSAENTHMRPRNHCAPVSRPYPPDSL